MPNLETSDDMLVVTHAPFCAIERGLDGCAAQTCVMEDYYETVECSTESRSLPCCSRREVRRRIQSKARNDASDISLHVLSKLEPCDPLEPSFDVAALSLPCRTSLTLGTVDEPRDLLWP